MCGQEGATTISFKVNSESSDPTPPLCMKCFKKQGDAVVKMFKIGQKLTA